MFETNIVDLNSNINILIKNVLLVIKDSYAYMFLKHMVLDERFIEVK